MRIGQGIDVHRFSDDADRELHLGLIRIDRERGLAGHSDADVATHALIDALLGAANLGDIGRHFPDHDPQYSGIASRTMLVATLGRVAQVGFRPVSADVTIIAEKPRLAEFMPVMSEELTDVMGCVVSVKATTTEGLGAIGHGEGIAASAIVLLEESS
ncbi:MAG: 2-C-methyl-D-erythritol 2,4-cyclodiphosphate synthase [Acidobacteria bacterium]|nr:2-C-methyl-D-erythritol 2,4-cyclodiphosphate synthase [Acidobacteriota bacterium]